MVEVITNRGKKSKDAELAETVKKKGGTKPIMNRLLKPRLIATVIFSVFLLLFAAGCKKKQPAPPPPPPPPPPKEEPKPPAAVIRSFTAEPSTVTRGQSSTLRWVVENASEVVIDQGIGTVPPRGERIVSPGDTTTYRMTARSAGGDAVAAVTVTVTAPTPPPPPPAKPKASLSERISREVQDIFFDYDKSEIREDARATLQRNVEALKSILNDFPSAAILIEGHCDERGSAEYNLGLGDLEARLAAFRRIRRGLSGAG